MVDQGNTPEHPGGSLIPNTPVAVATQENGVEPDLPTEHVIVGVDIGYTYTGVAICSTNIKLGEPIKPVPIQTWPGSDTTGKKVTNKVPTQLAYKAADLRPQSWGFACPSPRELGPMVVSKLFKFLLDKRSLEEMNRGKAENEQQSIENVAKWFTDFLSKLRGHIVAQLEGPDWRVNWCLTKVEYIFSLPTSWDQNDELVEHFREILEDAGFRSEDNISVTIGLTEGVASAVYTAKSVSHNFNQGDILLVCDAGGGTTDICALTVAAIDRKTVKLETIEQISIFAGSSQIDEAFEALYKDKLRVTKEEQSDSFKGFVAKQYAAEEVTRGTFQEIKVHLGTKLSTPSMKFAIPGVPDKVRVEFHEAEIEAMFDSQIDPIIAEIDKMLERLRAAELIVPSLFLAGGLGSSAYVQSKLAAHYEPKGMRILVDKDPSEPPLSVCKGLVLDRIQRLLYGTSVLRTRRCRASYGILYRKSYNKTEHKGRKIYIDPADGRKYVTDEIQWFIWKGQIIAEDALIKLPRERIASLEHANTTWIDTIVVSKLPHDLLPQYLDQGDSEIACKIPSKAESGMLTSKRKYWLVGTKVLHAKYEICSCAEQENIRFESRVNGVTIGEGQTSQVPWEYIQDDELEQP